MEKYDESVIIEYSRKNVRQLDETFSAHCLASNPGELDTSCQIGKSVNLISRREGNGTKK